MHNATTFSDFNIYSANHFLDSKSVQCKPHEDQAVTVHSANHFLAS